LAEAIDTLHGGGPHDLREQCLEEQLPAVASGKICESSEAKSMAALAASDDSAFEKFRLLVPKLRVGISGWWIILLCAKGS
jgi:thymidine phosphorylase